MVPRPCNPRVILSEAAPPAKNQARPPIIAAQSNPAPSGAPAGGISVVPARPRNAHRPPGTRTRGGALPVKSKIFRQPRSTFIYRKNRPQSLGLQGRLYVVFSARTRFFPDRCNQGCPDQPRRYGLHSPAPKAGQSRQLYKVEFETLFSSQNTISLP